MALYHEIVAGLEQGYPSSYNSLGHLAGVIGGVLGKVYNVARGVMSALPVVGRLAGALPVAARSVRQAYDDGMSPEHGSAAPPLSEQRRIVMSRKPVRKANQQQTKGKKKR
jgi:hypothetical protein